MYHSFLIHSSADGHLGYFQVLAFINSDEHCGTRVSFNSGFLGVYAQQWDCWVIWWLQLEPIIQSEVSQKEKHQYSILMHIYGI